MICKLEQDARGGGWQVTYPDNLACKQRSQVEQVSEGNEWIICRATDRSKKLNGVDCHKHKRDEGVAA